MHTSTRKQETCEGCPKFCSNIATNITCIHTEKCAKKVLFALLERSKIECRPMVTSHRTQLKWRSGISLLANGSNCQLANVLLATMTYLHQALMLWRAFALHLINCRLYCLFLAAIKVVEEEKVKKIQQQCIIWDPWRG